MTRSITKPLLPLLALVATLASPGVGAESMYVTDILRLGLHNSSDTSDTPFRTLVSGDELEVLQRTTYYAQVRTSDGTEGWVKASYLIDEKPAQAHLAQITGERNRLANELARFQAQLSENDGELASLRSDRENLKRNAVTVANEVATLRTENKTLTEKVAGYRYSLPVQWLLGIAVTMLVGGFLSGWWYADAKQRKRHGGFRI